MSSSLLRLSRSSTRSLLALNPTSTSTRSISSTSKLLASSETQDPQLGDYPQIKRENLQNRKWSPRYWNTQEKRNFGETVRTRLQTAEKDALVRQSSFSESSIILRFLFPFPSLVLSFYDSFIQKMILWVFGLQMFTLLLLHRLSFNSVLLLL